jgi:hypothetical protein
MIFPFVPVMVGLLLAGSLFFVGCKPSVDEQIKPFSKAELLALVRAHNYTPEVVERLNGIAAQALSQDERNTARVLVAESWMRADSPVSSIQLRTHLREIIRDAPEAWQASIAHLQLIRSYDVHAENSEMLVAINDAMNANRFHLLNAPQDPLLVSYLSTL